MKILFLPIAKRLWTSSQVNESNGTSSDAATMATVDKFLFNAVAWSWNSSEEKKLFQIIKKNVFFNHQLMALSNQRYLLMYFA